MLPNWLYGKSLKKLQEILNSGGQTAAGVSYSNTESGLEATNAQDAIDEVAEEVNTKMNWDSNSILGAKNLLPKLLTTSKTIAGATATPNNDGTISLSGQFTSLDSILLTDSWNDTNVEWLTRYEGQSVILSGGIAGAALGIWGNDSDGNHILFFDSGYDGGDSSAVTIPSGIVSCAVFIYPQSTSVEVDGKTLHPMLRLATDTDDSYVPYAMTNRELTKRLDADIMGSQVSLASYNSTNPYTLPADGYISGFGTWGSTQTLRIYDSSFTRNIALKEANVPIYVKKGFKVYMENVATDSGANFFPLT